jgi:hypothetical protein
MEDPVTQLDARFSHPDAVATEWDETRRVLETAELFWITTARTDGRPHGRAAKAVPAVANSHRAEREPGEEGLHIAALSAARARPLESRAPSSPGSRRSPAIPSS